MGITVKDMKVLAETLERIRHRVDVERPTFWGADIQWLIDRIDEFDALVPDMIQELERLCRFCKKMGEKHGLQTPCETAIDCPTKGILDKVK